MNNNSNMNYSNQYVCWYCIINTISLQLLILSAIFNLNIPFSDHKTSSGVSLVITNSHFASTSISILFCEPEYSITSLRRCTGRISSSLWRRRAAIAKWMIWTSCLRCFATLRPSSLACAPTTKCLEFCSPRTRPPSVIARSLVAIRPTPLATRYRFSVPTRKQSRPRHPRSVSKTIGVSATSSSRMLTLVRNRDLEKCLRLAANPWNLLL